MRFGSNPCGLGPRTETRDETHIPAIEPCPQATAWVPRAHGHQGRAQDPERPPGPWAEEAVSLTEARLDEAAPPSVDGPTAAPLRLAVLKKRSDFLAAAKGRREVTPGFILQVRPRGDGDPLVRVGYTCSKKVGNAVARNRAKRRLREIARLGLPACGSAGHDYVLIGRRNTTATLPFDTLRSHLTRALCKLQGPNPSEAARKGG